MHIHKAALFALSLVCLLTAACSLPLTAAPTPTLLILPSPVPPTAVPASPTPLLTALPATADPASQAFVTQIVTPGAAATTAVSAVQPSSAAFCGDAQATALIDSLKSALLGSKGAAFASLISPVHGMDARLYRDGRIVNYDQRHAKFLFESTYSVDWGAAPGSGMHTSGAFHDTILPDLLSVFKQTYTLSCNEVKVGGASYQTTWPYNGINFYSVHYPGTSANGNMDWHTWLIGMQYLNGRPYLYAIMQYKWEP